MRTSLRWTVADRGWRRFFKQDAYGEGTAIGILLVDKTLFLQRDEQLSRCGRQVAWTPYLFRLEN